MLSLLFNDKTNYFNFLNKDIIGIISHYTNYKPHCGYNGCQFLTCYYQNSDIKADFNPIIYIGHNQYNEVSSINFVCYNKSNVLRGYKWQLLLNLVDKGGMLAELFYKLEIDTIYGIKDLNSYIIDNRIKIVLISTGAECFLPLPCPNAIKCWQKAVRNIKNN